MLPNSRLADGGSGKCDVRRLGARSQTKGAYYATGEQRRLENLLTRPQVQRYGWVSNLMERQPRHRGCAEETEDVRSKKASWPVESPDHALHPIRPAGWLLSMRRSPMRPVQVRLLFGTREECPRTVPMSDSHQTLVRQQFDRQVAHYLASSPMAEERVIRAIIVAAPSGPGQRVLDVACGAGFLLQAYRDAGADVFGVDLSEAMLVEAGKTLSQSVPPDHLMIADAGQLPFADETFDVVTCKLAMHYFPEPHRVLQEMARVCRRSGLVALIDRVACDDSGLCAAQNRLEKFRTPNKVRVYSEGELTGLLAEAGVRVLRRELLIQAMEFQEWMAAAGASDRAAEARGMLFGPRGEDCTGLTPAGEAGQLVIHHRTLVLVGQPG
jgi:ubiquinone/menaquinone biosynthesis C-methylase UbiE